MSIQSIRSNSKFGPGPVVVACFVLALFAIERADAQGPQPTEPLVQQVQKLEEQIQSLRLDVEQSAKALEATADALEESLGNRAERKVSIKGYGELHYNRLDVNAGKNKRQLDFHRFVLFFGYHYSDRLRLISEVELEHALAGDGQPGEVELEQAYIEYDLSQHHRLRAGIFLVPVGYLNETHEPPTFYGVERNEVEKIILPTTWWAGGLGYSFAADNGLTFDLSIHEGLKIPADADARIRSGRQKTAEADGRHLAVTSRLRYTAVAGLELAASLQHQSDVTQASGDGIGAATLLSFQVDFRSGSWGLRSLYALWHIKTDASPAGQEVSAQGSHRQHGFYFEPSYRFNDNVGIFARYAQVRGGRLEDRFNQLSLGANFWPYEQVVLKIDYISRSHSESSQKDKNLKGINFGIGYYF